MTQPSVALDRRGLVWGTLAVTVALALGALGSGGLRWFDAALAGYLLAQGFVLNRLAGIDYPLWAQPRPTRGD